MTDSIDGLGLPARDIILLKKKFAAVVSTPGAHATSHEAGGADELTLDSLGVPVASVDFDEQQAINFVIENRTSDPAGPADGRIWLRTDL